MACIVLNQDNKALPQPLSYGNPDRLLSSPTREEVWHREGCIRWTPALKGRREAGTAGAFQL